MENNKKIIRVFYTLLVYLLLTLSLKASSIYFIHAGPPENYSQRDPDVGSIYEFNQLDNTLRNVWSQEPPKWLSSVRYYSSLKKIFIGYNEKHTSFYANKLIIMDSDSISKSSLIEVNSDEFIADYKYFTSPISNLLKVQLRKMNEVNSVEKIIDLKTSKFSNNDALSSQSLHDLKLSGINSSFYGNDSDVLYVKFNNEKLLVGLFKEYEFNTNEITDSIIKLKNTPGYVLFVNENNYLVITSIPFSNDISQREILVYNFNDKEWKSVLIEGNETKLRLVNGWLVGNVAYSDPETDWQKRHGKPSILTNKMILVNPITLEENTIALDQLCEFLWIDDNYDVYYRFRRDLYKAKLENGDFINQEIIISDPIVGGFHWAFRGSTGQ